MSELTITVHDGHGKNPTVLNKAQYDALCASGMMWEHHPDAPLKWPFPDEATQSTEYEKPCEGCGKTATHSDSEGVPLCKECFDELPLLSDEQATRRTVRLRGSKWMELDSTVCAEQHRQVKVRAETAEAARDAAIIEHKQVLAALTTAEAESVKLRESETYWRDLHAKDSAVEYWKACWNKQSARLDETITRAETAEAESAKFKEQAEFSETQRIKLAAESAQLRAEVSEFQSELRNAQTQLCDARAEVERLKVMTQTPAGWTERGEWKPECNSLYVYDAEGKLIGSNHPISAVAEEYRLRYERIQLRAETERLNNLRVSAENYASDFRTERDQLRAHVAELEADRARLVEVLQEDIISANIIAAEVKQAGVNRHGINRDVRFIIERCRSAIDAARGKGRPT